MTKVVRRCNMYSTNMLITSKTSISCLLRIKPQFGEFRGHSRKGWFYPPQRSDFQNMIFYHVSQGDCLTFAKKWNDFIIFIIFINSKPTLSFFPSRVSSSQCSIWYNILICALLHYYILKIVRKKGLYPLVSAEYTNFLDRKLSRSIPLCAIIELSNFDSGQLSLDVIPNHFHMINYSFCWENV